jgi:hypothetical protein
MMGLSTAKLIGLGVGALALIAALLWFKGVLNERAELRAWQGEVVTATREAAANPKLATNQVALQIQLLGKDIAQCKGALGRQNEAIGKLAADTRAAQDMAAKASVRAAERVERVGSTSERLTASARSSESQSKPCAPSKALTEAWR